MAGSISITLSSINDYKTVEVNGLGTIKVRKESSNQGLKNSENIRDIFRLQDEMKSLEKKANQLMEQGLSEDSPEVIKLTSKGTQKLNEITEIRKSNQENKKARLSDDEGGRLVDMLFDHASDDDIAKIFAVVDSGEGDDES